MLITKFSVERYRSIVQTESIDLDRMTVLVGPNNEGKSNLLRALTSGLEILGSFRDSRLRPTRSQTTSTRAQGYEWSEDFPLSLQSTNPNAKTVFNFEFSLTEDEVREFKTEVGSNLNGLLPIRILVGSEHRPTLKVVKKGPGGTSLNQKHEKISRFVSSRITVDYIPAVRSSKDVESTIDRDISRQLWAIQERPEVVNLYQQLHDSYTTEMKPYEEALLESLRRFIPRATSVRLRFDGLNPGRGLTPRARLMLDDGEDTLLSAKGDGIQSLTMLALKEAILDLDSSKSHVLTLEEPEAHLHPGAVRQLREVIQHLSQQHQVVLTTHNPILVDRVEPHRNIIVKENRASRAKTLDEIRSSLGVELPDNMKSAAVILLVEGTTDRKVIRNFILRSSGDLAEHLTTGQLRIEHCGGAANASYQHRLWRDNLCQVHILLDSDRAGRDAREKLLEDGVEPSCITMITARGYSCAEMEDFVSPESFRETLESHFNIKLLPFDEKSKRPRDRFTQEIRGSFDDAGQIYDAATANQIKRLVADSTDSESACVSESFDGVWLALQRGLLAKFRNKDELT